MNTVLQKTSVPLLFRALGANGVFFTWNHSSTLSESK